MTIIKKNITRYNSKTGFYIDIEECEEMKGWKIFCIGHVDYVIKYEVYCCEAGDEDIDTIVRESLWEWISFYIEQTTKETRFLEDIEETQEDNKK